MKKTNQSQAGFSLVEVTLALGVVVFCLVTIMGLLAVGINTTHVSTAQTAAVNILTAVASDVEATPNITPSYSTTVVKGAKAETSLIYGIALPAGGTGTIATTPQKIYIGENGQVVASASLALYQLNVWVNTSSTTQQETFVRLLITWPAPLAYTSAQSYVENIIAINRT
jgi:Tfp pilus assembly protein PilV